jgi:hypothetical protein
LRTPAQPIARSAARDFGRFRKPSLFPVLRAADLFHPVDGFSVELLLNGDVAHGRRRPAGFLRPVRPSPGARAAAGSDNQRLTERVGGQAVRARLEVTLAPATRAGSGGLNKGSIRTPR